jgi:DNA primase
LHQRGLNDDIIKEFRIGCAPNKNNLIYQMATNSNGIFGTTRSKELI